MMIGSQSFGTNAKCPSNQNSKSKILMQIQDDKCPSKCKVCSSELSQQLKCLTFGKVRSKSRGWASGEEIWIVQGVEIFWKDGISPRISPRLLFFVQFPLLFPSSRFLLRIGHSLNKNLNWTLPEQKFWMDTPWTKRHHIQLLIKWFSLGNNYEDVLWI